MSTESSQNKAPLICVILDGWGLAPDGQGNAISLAETPVLDSLRHNHAATELWAHGSHVGLPEGQVGNSEAGHTNIGAGRLVEQDAVRISRSIDDGTFFKNSAFMGAIRHIRKMKSDLHLIGLLSNGQSPHSDPRHLSALIKLAHNEGVPRIFLHLFTDGRDSPRFASFKLIDELEKELGENDRISTLMGRFYGMDRKKKWSRVEQTYQAIVNGVGRQAQTAKEAILEAYNRGESDEFIEPYVISDSSSVCASNENHACSRIKDGDSVVFFNLRSDRSRQLAKAFVQKDFEKMNPGAFRRENRLEHLYFVAMTDFGPDLDDILTAFPSIDVKETLPTALRDKRQLYLAETEKYAHVTYFFNGGYSGTVADEDQYMIESPDVKSYDETPLMSTKALIDLAIANLKSGEDGRPKYDFTLMNIAAPDMIGHTGNLKAGIECCSGVDKELGRLVDAYLAVGGTLIISADHGNIEAMLDLESGEILTEHTTNKVPFVVVRPPASSPLSLHSEGSLSDIAPTILDLLGVSKPELMSGNTLIKNDL